MDLSVIITCIVLSELDKARQVKCSSWFFP